MLHLILGRAGAGKTTYVHKLLEDFVRDGEREMLLIVPEQYSFFTERALLERLGAKDAGKIEVLSFSRLAHSVFRIYGGKTGQHIDDSGRAILMSLALESVGDKLHVYARHKQSTAVITEMLGLSSEFKQNSVLPEEISEVSDGLPDCLLKEKTREISLILSAYDALVRRSFFDEQDSLTNLYDTLLEQEYFKNRTVVLDAFRGFTGQELRIIERILVQSKNTYITLCTDEIYPLQGDTGVFGHTKRTAGKLLEAAKKNNVPAANPLTLSGAGSFPPEFTRAKEEALAALEAGLYVPAAPVYEKETQAITLVAAGDIVSECEFVAFSIKKLIREQGLRCRDIAVIARSAESYEAQLKSALKKCEVPVFIDKRQPVITQPLITMVRSAVEIAANGFSLDAVMRYLKTGLAGYTTEEISTLENYALLWNINGNRWLQEWTAHPGGYGSDLFDKDAELLAAVNQVRAGVSKPLAKLRAGFEDADGESAAKAVYELLKETGAGEHLKNLAIALEDNGEPAIALEQERLWDDLMAVLDNTATALKGSRLSAKRFRELFDLIISTRSLGTLPQGLDEITIGSADRIRTASPKAVFIVGANEGVFPANPVSSGVLNDLERKKLIDLGLKVSEPGEFKIIEERFISYTALCSASEKLYVSYARKDLSGAQLSPSELVAQIKSLFPNCRMRDTADIPDMETIEGAMPAFELTAKLQNKGGELYASLRAYFGGREDFRDKLQALERTIARKDFEMENRTAGELFGKNMYLSASRVESFSQCAFAYFCKYGLKAEPRKIAELDPLQKGTILHLVLEKLFSKYPGRKLIELGREQRLSEIRAIMDEYLEEKMGGMQEKPKRFAYLYNRLANIMDEVVSRLAREFENCSFEPVDFELKIDNDGSIPPYEIALQDGGTLKIHGSVDRVDKMEKDGKSYIRVVDYKSSGKNFSLADVLEGINMQMLIYLFAIWQNGASLYGDIIPAGVLYMAANAPTASLGRDAGPGEVETEKIKKSKMSGMLLKDRDIILGMEKDGEGVFIPAKLNNGELTGTLITLEQIGKLKTKADEILGQMATALHNGNIKAYPAAVSNKTACDYCDYKTVCGRENGMPVRTVAKLDHEEALAMIEQRGGGGDGMDG